MLISEVRKNQESQAAYVSSRGTLLDPELENRTQRHPFIARSRAAVGIVFHAVTRPHKPAIINLDTGDVTTVGE